MYRSAFRGMAVFFNLRGKGASPLGPQLDSKLRRAKADYRKGKARPIDGRVAIGVERVEQASVLDGQKRLHHERGHGIERGVGSKREFRFVNGTAMRINNRHAGPLFLAVWRIIFFVDHFGHCFGYPRLGLHNKAALLQPLDELRNIAIAKALVVGTVAGKPDARRRPWAVVYEQSLPIFAKYRASLRDVFNS